MTYINTFSGLDIARGLVPGTGSENKFGENPDIGTSEEDIWDAGGDYPWQTSAQALEIVSDDTNDTNGGTGANTVYIEGLDSSWDIQSETVTMNGTTAVALANSYLRVYRAYVATSGSTKGNAGTLTIRLASAGATQAAIQPGKGQTLMAIYTIPNGKTGYLESVYLTSAKKTGALITGELLFRNFTDDTWRVQTRVSATDASNYIYTYPVPRVFVAKSDLRFRAVSSTAGTSISAGFDLVLVDN